MNLESLVGRIGEEAWQALKRADRLARPRRPAPAGSVERLPDEVLDGIESLLIFKPDALGDAVCSLPALVRLKERFPRARRYLLCRSETRPLYERADLFDGIGTIPVRWRLGGRLPYADAASGIRELRINRVDCAVYLRTYPFFFGAYRDLPVSSGMWIHPAHARMRLPSDRNVLSPRLSLRDDFGRAHAGAHQTILLQEILVPLLGAPETVPRFPSLRWTDADRRAIEKTFGTAAARDYVVVHPYAPIETRRYPAESWQAVVDALRREGIVIAVVGGPGDTPFLAGAVDMTGKLGMGETGYLISRAGAFVGNESGPAHWAASLGVPTIALFGGHSAPGEWGPHGARLIGAEVACSPCHRRYCSGKGVACLSSVRPELVGSAIRDVLASATSSGSSAR